MNKETRDWLKLLALIVSSSVLLLFAIPPVEYAFKMREAMEDLCDWDGDLVLKDFCEGVLAQIGEDS